MKQGLCLGCAGYWMVSSVGIAGSGRIYTLYFPGQEPQKAGLWLVYSTIATPRFHPTLTYFGSLIDWT